MFALNEHVTKTGAPLLDATFLGTLQLKSHRFLLETCLDEPNPSPAVVRALTALGNAWMSTYRKPKVTDAIRMLSALREAAQTKREKSPNLQLALANWVTEKDEEDSE
jgi:hypothetical protein